MNTIEMDYQQTIAQVKKLKELADRLDGIADRRVSASLDGLECVWEGATSEIFLRKGRKLQAKYGSLAKKIRNTADSLERSARRIYEMEQRAMQMVSYITG